MEIIEFATLKHVPILKAGTHRSRNAGAVTITEKELDETLQGSNELAQLMRQGHIPAVFAEGNTRRKLPAPLNLMHDDILDDTIRERVKDVQHSFAKDGEWLVENFQGVPTDVAKSIQSHFPLRSVDLIPWTNPETGKEYKRVVVSTAFLNRQTRPAVDGQSEHLNVEFAGGSEEDPVIVLYSGTDEQPPPQEGGPHMAENMKKEQKAVEESGPGENVSELMQAKDAEIARLKALTQADSGKITELEAERKAHADAIAELQRQQDEKETDAYLKEFAMSPHYDAKGIRFEVCPGFVELVAPLVKHTAKNAVIELAEGTQPARDVLKDVLEKVIEKAVQNAIVAPVTEMGRMTHTPPKSGGTTLEEEIAQMLKENPALSYGTAWQRAAEKTGFFDREDN